MTPLNSDGRNLIKFYLVGYSAWLKMVTVQKEDGFQKALSYNHAFSLTLTSGIFKNCLPVFVFLWFQISAFHILFQVWRSYSVWVWFYSSKCLDLWINSVSCRACMRPWSDWGTFPLKVSKRKLWCKRWAHNTFWNIWQIVGVHLSFLLPCFRLSLYPWRRLS